MRNGRSAAPEAAQPLPPERRTVGQLVAETLRLYGRRFWLCLPLGISVAALNQIGAAVDDFTVEWLILMLTLGAVLMTAAYVAASAIAAAVPLTPRTAAVALAAGVVVFVPVPILLFGFIPGVLAAAAWLALTGLAVPAAVVERVPLGRALRRGVELARADYVHALGSLATVALAYFLTRTMLMVLLRGVGDQTLRIAAFLADLVISPLLFLGAALLYVDQRARLETRARPGRRERRAERRR